MFSKDNCGECYFYDGSNQKEKKIHCILHQEWRGQYTANDCNHWTPHRNDSSLIKESRAKEIRNSIKEAKRNQATEKHLEETKELVEESISETKKQGEKGTSATRRWAIIGIIGALIIGGIYLVITKLIMPM